MEKYLPYLTTIGSVIAFLFAAFKHISAQKLAEKNKRFEQFHRVFEWVAGRTADGKNSLIHNKQWLYTNCQSFQNTVTCQCQLLNIT